jgi:hypothetical protein
MAHRHTSTAVVHNDITKRGILDALAAILAPADVIASRAVGAILEKAGTIDGARDDSSTAIEPAAIPAEIGCADHP